MTQFIIHVGLHKTGTTYLQEAFALSRPQFAEHGIHYPSVWGHEVHHKLYDALGVVPNPALEAEFAEIHAGGHKTVLISGEGLSVLPPSAIAYLGRLVGPDTPVRIAFYIRAWSGPLPSLWKQAVKGGETPTLPEYLLKHLSSPAASRLVNFGLILHSLATAFGKDAIRIVAYDQVVAAKRDLFSHFVETFLALPNQPAPGIRPSNVSPGAADIEVIRALAALECARRNEPIPTPVAVRLVARYLRRKPAFETPALARALAAHSSMLTVNETSTEMAALHRELFAEFGQCLVPPRLPGGLFRLRKVEVPFIRSDYLLAPDVQRELVELHRLICIDRSPALRSATPSVRSAAAPVLQLHDPTAAPPAPVNVVSFRAGGNSDAFIGGGWSIAERGCRWSVGPTCDVRLSPPAVPGDYVLTMRARPFVLPGRIAAQRLMLEANGMACGEVALAAVGTVSVTLPWDVVGSAETLLLRFRFPDAVRPLDVVPNAGDRRSLGLGFEWLSPAGPLPTGAAGPAARAQPAAPTSLVDAATDVMARFESLGEDCEFGLAQRCCGLEGAGLLRFSATPLAPLMTALQMRFKGLGDPGSLELGRDDKGDNYVVRDKRFGLRYHTWLRVGERAPRDVLEREHQRVPRPARKLVEDLTQGQKIFVYRGMSPAGEAQVHALFAVMRAYGDGRLLWVDLADANHPPGSVIELAPGLLKDHIDRFAPAGHALDLSLACWLEVCRNAIGAPM